MISKQRIDYYLIALLGVLLAVIAFKWNHLNTPYFWDEAWVYAPAVQTMNKTGLSLLPTALHIDLSRGHPLVFHFLAAVWVRIFGTGFIAVHSFPLFISLLLLYSVYSFGKHFFSSLVGFSAALLLAVQPLFLAQSAMLLPEVMLTLWTVLAFYFYLRNMKTGFIVFSVLMLLTKESGLVFLVAIGCWELLDGLILQRKKIKIAQVLINCSLPLIPLALASVFFIIQKFQHGWFFYPDHLKVITFSLDVISNRLISFYDFTFERQGRYVLIFSVIAGLLFLIKKLSLTEKIIIGCSYLAIAVFFATGKFFSSNIAMAVVILLLVLVLAHSLIAAYAENYNTLRILVISVLFTGGFFMFCALNTFTTRYLFVIFPFVITAFVYLIHSSVMSRKWIFALLIGVSSLSCLRAVNTDEVSRDYSMSYLEAVTAQKKMTDYLVENKMQDKKIFANWLSVTCLTQPYAGYITAENYFPGAIDVITPEIEYCIFTNIEMNVNYDSLIMFIELEPVISIEEKSTWIDIYKFKGFSADTTTVSKQEMDIRKKRRDKYRNL
ncbi:MAG: ArnT family glycosyltransferase [Bacteroidia bacterium]